MDLFFLYAETKSRIYGWSRITDHFLDIFASDLAPRTLFIANRDVKSCIFWSYLTVVNV